MSRIGKKPVIIPEGVSIEFKNNIFFEFKDNNFCFNGSGIYFSKTGQDIFKGEIKNGHF